MKQRVHIDLPPLPVEKYAFIAADQGHPEHVYFRGTYELGGEVEPIRQAFFNDKTRRRYDAQGNWHFVVQVQEWIGEGHTECVNLVLEKIVAPPGFPDKPYLSTNHIITDASYAPLPNPNRCDTLPAIAPVTWNGHQWLADGTPWPHDYVYFMGVNWNRKNTPLGKAFANWLRIRRPADVLADSNAGKDKQKRWYTILKAVGVYRLARHYGSVSQAFRAIEKIDHRLLSTLYMHEEDWHRANKLAKQLIELWSRTTGL